MRKVIKAFWLFCAYLSIILSISQRNEINGSIISKNDNGLSKKLNVHRYKNPSRLSVLLCFNWESDSKDEVI